DPGFHEHIKHLPYRVINDEGEPLVLVDYKGSPNLITPEEITALLIAKLKMTAEAHLKQKVEKAVITVPWFFNEEQREAVQAAGSIAGLDVSLF
ncbi:hypothetical protein PENTCL1PPCAC_21135, partial [Pristionchus entomophagus]